ncbi:phosphotransferase family protein [Solirubrobacter ginsenosidimutans]|uniref:Phosphotransferase family protein n=1 Tax=Solirubrobacter ginsenosidimutans TaxID=490573 RepID=A0A9X3MQ18_9ACTN|nr:phosphotransferase family protein [Solirubrobacter ginsenosidimutans]MDA0160329.1 phosphotransferase family protein [Solirubrobacter ginsenosidimutans]
MEVDPELAAWLRDALGEPGPFTLERLSGGNSNETLVLRGAGPERILRRPPAASIAPSAHAMDREFRVLRALAGTGVPAPAPLACGRGMLVMERVPGFAPTTARPYGVCEAGEAVVDALAALHGVDWRAVGLEDFGRPEGFLERQVARWRGQYERVQVRSLPRFDAIADWLEANRPDAGAPAILHGDFHADNCLLSAVEPVRVTAIIDWEMATIGDPLLDLGLLLAFWGSDRPEAPAMPRVQAFSRSDGAPSRGELAARYAERSGRSVDALDWYMALAFWKLAAIVEGAYAQYLDGRLTSSYAQALGDDVPRLLDEAAAFAGLVGSHTAR